MLMLPEHLTPSLTNGINHVATLTADLGRLKSFYEDVLGARTLFDLEDNGVRHAMIMLGPASGVHAFEVEPTKVPQSQPMFERGRLDHVAITAATAESFVEIRARAMRTGLECEVVDYGAIVAFNLEDPDGSEIEICCFKPGVDLTTPPPDRAAAGARIRS
jgi:catechol 2,3-dioxygenase-like lactoylglutathione lyase family enzyme